MKDNILKIIIIILLVVVIIIGVLILLKNVDKKGVNPGNMVQMDGNLDGNFKESIDFTGESTESFPLQ